MEKAGGNVRVLVVWERILISDRLGVRKGARERISGDRAIHFWDPERLVSRALGGPSGVEARGARMRFSMGETVWDYVAVYRAGVKWESGKAIPTFAGGQVEGVLEEVRTALRSVSEGGKSF